MVAALTLVRAGCVWLTAVMTLVAGMPRFTCACPDGTRKTLCLGPASKSSNSCCGGACCAKNEAHAKRCCHGGDTASEKHGQAAVCCATAKSGKFHSASGRGVMANHGCCSRTLGDAQTATLPNSKTAVNKDFSLAAIHLPATLLSVRPPAPGGGPTFRPIDQSAPSIDLIALLQHYLI
jgi:hypothetical protein